MMDSAIRSASPEAWSRGRARTSITWRLYFAFFAILLVPAFLIGLYFGFGANARGALIVGLASAVLAIAAGGITAGVCNYVFGKPGSDVTGAAN